MKTCYTRHAWTRVLGRLALGPGEVADILDWSVCVDVGIEPGTHRVHRLFFSVPDDMCFVAVQDSRNGAVITVLPLDFHQTLAWHVSDAAQAEARALATGEARIGGAATIAPASSPAGGRVSTTGSAAPTQFRLSAYFRTPEGVLRVANLGAWPCAAYENRVELLLEDDSFFAALDNRLQARAVDKVNVQVIYVRVGNYGSPVRLAWTHHG